MGGKREGRRLLEIADLYDNRVTKTLQFFDFENTLQSYRTENIIDLHNYTINSASLADGQKILDAGCGLGGPSLWFAKKFDVEIFAMNISKVQVSKMKDLVRESELKGKIEVLNVDFHEMAKLFPKNSFDRILFLESFGHSLEKEKLLKSSLEVLKPGGKLYIKDPFIFRTVNPFKQRKILKAIKKADSFFYYEHITEKEMLKLLKMENLDIDYFRKPAHANDLRLPLEYDNFNKLDYFDGKKAIAFVNCFEICCTKK